MKTNIPCPGDPPGTHDSKVPNPNQRIMCDEAKWLMSEALSDYPPTPTETLLNHLDTCPDCKAAYQDLEATLQVVNLVPSGVEEVRPELWEALEKQIAVTPQLSGPQPSFLAPREVLMAQYTYLTVLGTILFVALVEGQPLFLDLMSTYGITVPGGIMADYGLLILFLCLGAFSAILAVPILVQAEFGNTRGKSWFGRMFALFSGNLRLFAC